MKSSSDYPVLLFATQVEWEAWLSENCAVSAGVWLKLSKKGSGICSVSYAEAVESALCYGWIDGQAASFDDQVYLQKFTHRRSRSQWSQVNRDRAEALITAGRMQPEGLREVELARADGRWEAAYASPSQASVPEDLQAALDQDPQAKAFFESLNSTNRFAILYRIQTAKKPETRAARIRKFVEMLQNGQKIYP